MPLACAATEILHVLMAGTVNIDAKPFPAYRDLQTRRRVLSKDNAGKKERCR